MEDVQVYLQLGLEHVLDPNAYDHVLFMAALAAPYGLSDWRKVVWLATVFTIAHCTSLALSAFGLASVNTAWIEFLIPVTIAATALYNIWNVWRSKRQLDAPAVTGAAVFGLIHGFGFSNYFNSMVFGLEDKIVPLLGFAFGIEISQVVVILSVLLLSALVLKAPGLQRSWWVYTISAIVFLISIPLLMATLGGLTSGS